MRRITALTLVLLLGAPAASFAEEPAATARAPRRDGSYGGQILLGDVGALALPLATGRDGLVFTYTVASPLVHVAHDRADRAALSLGLHLVLPALGAMVAPAGCELQSGDRARVCERPFALGALLGALVATTVDVIVASRPAGGW